MACSMSDMYNRRSGPQDGTSLLSLTKLALPLMFDTKFRVYPREASGNAYRSQSCSWLW